MFLKHYCTKLQADQILGWAMKKLKETLEIFLQWIHDKTTSVKNEQKIKFRVSFI